MQLTKSEFLDYLTCASAFWLKKKRPEAIEWPAPGTFDRLLMRDGYAVEAEARKLVTTWPDREACDFQIVFTSEDGLQARADLVRRLDDGRIDLFEIKGSTGIKASGGQDHVVDACFQRIVAERAGESVRSVFIVHVNSDYVREGPIDPAALLTIVDVSDAVADRKSATEEAIFAALSLLGEDLDEGSGCSCRHVGSLDRRCAAFGHFNPDVPDLSVHLLPRISEKRLKAFDADGRFGIGDAREDELTEMQRPVWRAISTGEPVIDKAAVNAFVEACAWPLYFYDYETFASAVPLADGHAPHQAMPVQFSLHVLGEDGSLAHHEFLADGHGMQQELVEALATHIPAGGTIVSWSKSFENGCNKRMAALLPQWRPFLEDVIARTVDLMDPFKTHYVHPAFRGSTSIKKVLPALCPHLAYEKNAVHDGAAAMEAWSTMVETDDADMRSRLRNELLAYCRLDSLAMVEIFKVVAQR